MLNHKGTIILETERLILRKFEMSDAEAMYSNWSSDPEVSKYMRWDFHKSIEDTKQIIQSRLDRYSNLSYYLWAITVKGSDEVIGSIGLFVVNEKDLCGEVAYCIGRKHHGQGYVTEALKRILKFAFEEIGFNRIEAYHAVNNPASGRVMQKAGMHFEGMMRQKYKSAVGFEDSNLYAILKEDYNEITIKLMP